MPCVKHATKPQRVEAFRALVGYIAGGGLPEFNGTTRYLKTEKALAGELLLPRQAVREALAILTAWGVVEQYPGRGVCSAKHALIHIYMLRRGAENRELFYDD